MITYPRLLHAIETTHIPQNKQQEYGFLLSYFRWSNSLYNTSKYESLARYMRKSIFIPNPIDRQNIMCILFIYQKHYFALLRFIKLCKFKLYKKYDNPFDFHMNSLKDLKESHRFSIIQNRCVYDFSILDLIKVIKRHILYSKFLIIDVKVPKNPYTNIEFSKCDLYNIYFHIIHKTDLHIPYYIHCYFQCGLSKKKFKEYNSFHMKECAVRDYIADITTEEAFVELKTMFLDMRRLYKTLPPIRLNDTLSEKQKIDVISVSKKVLFYYLLLEYIHESDELYVSTLIKLRREALKLYTKYPTLGRKRIKIKRSRLLTGEVGENSQ